MHRGLAGSTRPAACRLLSQLLSTLDARKTEGAVFSTPPTSRFTSQFWVSKVRKVERVSRNKSLPAGISTSSSPWSSHRALEAEEPCWLRLQRSTSGAQLRFIIQDKKKSWVLFGSDNLDIWIKKYIPINLLVEKWEQQLYRLFKDVNLSIYWPLL